MGKEQSRDQKNISLPKGPSLDLELGRALVQRRSVRSYTGDPIEIGYLATLLRAGNGVVAEGTICLTTGKEMSLRFRTAPSAGGLYPIELYIGVLNVNGLEQGIYHYHANTDCLEPYLPSEAIATLLSASSLPEEMIAISRSNIVLLMIGKPLKTMRKYGNRGLKMIYQEAGAISQNIQLACIALGLGSVDCAGFYDSEVHRLMSFDGINETLIHAMIIGMPG